MKVNTEMVIKRNPQQIKGYIRGLTNIYGKKETLQNVIIDLKKRKFNQQIKFVKEKFKYG